MIETAAEILLVIASVAALAVSCYFDIKTREIPDWASWGLVIAALVIRAIMAYTYGWPVFFAGILGMGAAVLVGLGMYYTHQWGGGDAKLLFGFGAVIGISYPWSTESLRLALFLVGLFAAGAIWGLIWMIGEAAVKKGFTKALMGRIHEYRRIVVSSMIGAAILSVAAWLMSIELFIPLLLFVPAMIILFLFVKTVEQECFIRDVAPAAVTEGDWLAEKVEAKSAIIDKRTLESEDVAMIKEWGERGIIKKVRIKYGVPFAPSFAAAYVLVIYFQYLR